MCRLRLIATLAYLRFVFAAFFADCREVRSRVSSEFCFLPRVDGRPACGRGAGTCVVTCQDRIPLVVGHVGMQFTADPGQRVQFIGRGSPGQEDPAVQGHWPR